MEGEREGWRGMGWGAEIFSMRAEKGIYPRLNNNTEGQYNQNTTENLSHDRTFLSLNYVIPGIIIEKNLFLCELQSRLNGVNQLGNVTETEPS